MSQNQLIARCLEELKNNEETRERFNSLSSVEVYFWVDGQVYFKTGLSGDHPSFKNSNFLYKKEIVLSFLSRTPDGKAVMEFLDLKNLRFSPTYTHQIMELKGMTLRKIDKYNKTKDQPPKTLDHLLYREFTEALRSGKTLDEALDKIEKIYLENIK